ncbi:hypothetical protein EMN47_01985 [Prolixibacteraceae bacterium JC049]|nr:hypothetical protein [Prolixibacteraceae bacterium JC049]
MSSAKQALGNIFTGIILQPIAILTSILVARTLGPEGKGVYTFLMVLSTTLMPILLFGIDAGFYQSVSSGSFKAKDNFVSILLVGLFHGLITGLIIFGAWYLNLLGETVKKVPEIYFICFLFTIPMSTIFHLTNRTLMSDCKFRIVNISNIIRTLLTVASLVFFVIIMKLDVDGAIFSILFINGVYSLLFVTYAFKVILNSPLKFNKTFIKSSYQYGFKAWFGNIASIANDKFDQLILGLFSSASQLGIYSVGYNYSKLLNKPIDGMFKVLYNRTAVNQDQDKAQGLVEQIHRVLVIIVAPIALGLMLFSKTFIKLMYGNEFLDAIGPTYVLIPGMFMFLITRRIIQLFLMARGFPSKSSIVQIVGALAGAILYCILIPKFDIMGAAWGTTIAFIISTIVAFYFYRKIVGNRKTALFSLHKNDLGWIYNKLRNIVAKK